MHIRARRLSVCGGDEVTRTNPLAKWSKGRILTSALPCPGVGFPTLVTHADSRSDEFKWYEIRMKPLELNWEPSFGLVGRAGLEIE